MIEQEAKIITKWINQEAEVGNMLPKTAEDVREEIVAGDGVVFYQNGQDGQVEEKQPVAYCRILVWPEAGVEVGSLVVEPESRRQGHGSKAMAETVGKAKARYPGKTIFALTENPKSTALVEKIGGKPLSKDQLPQEVWDLCTKPGSECRHSQEFPDCPCVPFDLTNLEDKEE